MGIKRTNTGGLEGEMEERLYDAAVKGEPETLQQLIQEDPLLLDKVGLSCQDKNPLHIAAMFGHVEFVKAILKVNANMCLARDRFGRNPLHLAAIEGKTEVIQELIHANPLAAREKVDGGGTVLHLCIKYNQLDALKFLLKTIEDDEFANMKDADGMTVLHLAICGKQNQTIRHLLDNEVVDVNARNANGNTALDLLREETNSELAQSLKNAGAQRAGKGAEYANWLTQRRSTLMVVASLIATFAFQAGVTPPGGVWQEDSPKNEEPHSAGNAVMDDEDTFLIFTWANTIAFVLSLSTILLLTSESFLRHRFFVWALTAIMWLTMTAAAFAYCMSIYMVTTINYSTPTVAIMTWFVVMGLLLVVNTIRLVKERTQLGKNCFRKIRNVNQAVQCC